MKLKLTADQVTNIRWVEWKSAKHKTTVAHAVDPTSVERTGVLRTVTGAVVPPQAVDAAPGTPRDQFSLDVLARVGEVRAEREEAEAARAAKRKAPSDGVTIRGETAEVWKGGVKLGEFPASALVTLPALVAAALAPAPKARKSKKGDVATAE
jgi:hypothetical protein